ncbi:hypothetical protein IQ215_09990 [Cyanobacterium stanieri LEGE 03274]|uniref:Uncharacterized protein n=1 Tax=Cyanobacterium stanieri LEGE 03274 TaxID=1828756 RepID=A0ABR9V873_9CHRO|nr:hypothetical protein [Cyanobacterium stanieri]MBE9223024.1 hypothetical protein [Cyanobacterium stanieri LEGE 03274]
MTSNNSPNPIQQGLRIAIGATASAVETIQDRERFNQKISELTRDLQAKSEVWAQKGALTEEEAKKMIEDFFNQKNDVPKSSNKNQSGDSNPSREDLRTLTQEVISLREELNKLNSKSSEN